MSSQVTVTGKVGPGSTITAQVLTNVTFFSVDTVNEVLTVVTNGLTKTVDISADTTITVTVSGNSYTVSIS